MPNRPPTVPLYRFDAPPVDDGVVRRVVLLGATGSIGRQAVDLVLRRPERLRIVGLAARSDVAGLRGLLQELESAGAAERPAVAFWDETARAEAARDPLLGRRLAPAGRAGLCELAAHPDADTVVNGLVGAVGLEPTLAAARAGRRIALANKESLVVGGALVQAACAAGGATVLPVDSEHSALAQCLRGRSPAELERLVLTASGGPFRGWSPERMARATLAEVLAHPTWNMGPKISVDSATLMNKGLEIIEAHILFGTPYERIDVVVHPGSTVHSLAVFRDGSVMAQLGTPDMRVPLLYALSGEEHRDLETERLDLVRLGTLRFEAPDPLRFPCLALAREAGRAGGLAPVVLNGANEAAVAALLAGRIDYKEIAGVIAGTLERIPNGPLGSLEEALDTDARARREATALIEGLVP